MFRRLADISTHVASHIVRCVRVGRLAHAGVMIAMMMVAISSTYAAPTNDRTLSDTQRLIHLARERRQALEPMLIDVAKLPTTDARVATLRMRITSTYTLIARSEDSLVSVFRDGRAALASAGCAIRPFTETCATIAASSDAVSAYIAWAYDLIAARSSAITTNAAKSSDIVVTTRQLAADWKKINQTRATLIDELTMYRSGQCANDYYLWDCVEKQVATGTSLATRVAALDASMIDTRMRIFARIPRATVSLLSLERDAASCTTGVCETKLTATSLRQELALIASAALTLEATPSRSTRDITRLRVPTSTDVGVRFDRAYDHLTRSVATYDACLVTQKNDATKCTLQKRTLDASRETFAATVTPLQTTLTGLDEARVRVDAAIADVHLATSSTCRADTTDTFARLAGEHVACDVIAALPSTSLADTKYHLLARIGETRTKLASAALIYRADEVATVKKEWDAELAATYGEDAIRDDTYRAKEAAFKSAEATFDQKERAFAQCLKYQTTDGQCNEAAAAWDTAMRAYATSYGDFEGYHNERVATMDAELAKLDAAIVDGLPSSVRKAAIKSKAFGSDLIHSSLLKGDTAGISGVFDTIGNAFGPTGVTGGSNQTIDSVTQVGLDTVIGAGVGAGVGMLTGNGVGSGVMIGALAGGGLSTLNQMTDGKESIASSLIGGLFNNGSSSSSSSSYSSSSGGGRGSSGGILGDVADMFRVSIDGQRGTNASFGGAFGLLGGLVNAKLSVSAGNRQVVAGCSGAGSELHGGAFSGLKVNSNLGLSLPIGAINIPLGGKGNTSIPTGTCTAPAVLDGPGAQAGLTTFKASYKGNTYGDLIGMITGWTNFVLPFVSVIAIAALIYAGFLYLTAGVNEENTTKAKTIVLYVVLGIVLIFSAYAIVNTVLSGQAN